MFNEQLNAPASRWISVTFLQGEGADEVLSMIHRSAACAAIAHLQSLDYGDETTDAALTNGYVYDRIPAGPTDKTVEDARSPYALTYSAQFRYVSLLRRYATEPESELASTPGRSLPQHAQPRHGAVDLWTTTQGKSANSARPTVAL